MRTLLLCCTSLLCVASLWGQSDDKSTTLNPVVVTGTGTYHKANNSPVAVKVISAKDLQDAQVTTLQEALNRLTTNITTHTLSIGNKGRRIVYALNLC